MRGGFKVFVSGTALVAMTMAGASTAAAQEPKPAPAPQQTPATPAEQAPADQKPVFPLPQSCQDCDVALITILINPGSEADFEMVLQKVKESLTKSEKPERKQQATGWVVFKSTTPVQGKTVYIMRIDPIVKGAEYDLMRIIADVFPVEVQEIFTKYKAAFGGRAVTEMKRFMAMQD
jgi:cytochrome c5